MKITVVGAGNVGSSAAYALILRQLVGEMILIAINENLLYAKGLELTQSIVALNLDINLTCTKDYSHTKNSDIVYLAPASTCVKMLESLGVMARLGFEGVMEIVKLDISLQERAKF